VATFVGVTTPPLFLFFFFFFFFHFCVFVGSFHCCRVSLVYSW
jgi:hypothetical protein